MTLLPIFPLSHLSVSLCELFQRSKSMPVSVPSSPLQVKRTTLSGTAAKSTNKDLDAPCDNEAGTARMILGSFEEYVCMSDCGLRKNSKNLMTIDEKVYRTENVQLPEPQCKCSQCLILRIIVTSTSLYPSLTAAVHTHIFFANRPTNPFHHAADECQHFSTIAR